MDELQKNNSIHSDMYAAMSEKLAESKKANKKLKIFLIVLTFVLLLLFAFIYQKIVLDYAEIENVQIEQVINSRKIKFKFDVKTAGKLDFYYGKTILSINGSKDKNFLFFNLI